MFVNIYTYIHVCMCIYIHIHGFPDGSDGKDPYFCTQETQGLIPNGTGEVAMLPIPVFLPEIQAQRRLKGHSPWGCKEPDLPEQLTLSLSYITLLYCKN